MWTNVLCRPFLSHHVPTLFSPPHVPHQCPKLRVLPPPHTLSSFSVRIVSPFLAIRFLFLSFSLHHPVVPSSGLGCPPVPHHLSVFLSPVLSPVSSRQPRVAVAPRVLTYPHPSSRPDLPFPTPIDPTTSTASVISTTTIATTTIVYYYHTVVSPVPPLVLCHCIRQVYEDDRDESRGVSPPFGFSHETPASINLLLPPPSYCLDLYEDHPHATGAARQEEYSQVSSRRDVDHSISQRAPGPQD